MREQLVTDFDKIISDSNFSKKDIELKRISLDKFIEDGFPTKKKEDWKFLDINRAIEKNIGQLDFYNDYSFQNKIDTSSFVKGLEQNKIVFINGRIEKIDFKSEDNNKIEIIEESSELIYEKNDLKNKITWTTYYNLIDPINRIFFHNLKDEKIVIFTEVYDSHYRTAFKMFKDNKYFGVGNKMFRKLCADEKYYVNKFSCSTHPHNLYLQIESFQFRN